MPDSSGVRKTKKLFRDKYDTGTATAGLTGPWLIYKNNNKNKFSPIFSQKEVH
jgi:hypothetical protein